MVKRQLSPAWDSVVGLSVNLIVSVLLGNIVAGVKHIQIVCGHQGDVNNCPIFVVVDVLMIFVEHVVLMEFVGLE